MSRNQPIAGIGTENVCTCEGSHMSGGPISDPLRSWWENACVSMVFELFEVTCASHVWTLLHNSPFGATLPCGCYLVSHNSMSFQFRYPRIFLREMLNALMIVTIPCSGVHPNDCMLLSQLKRGGSMYEEISSLL